MSSAVRDAFMVRLQTRVYNYLKSHKLFGNWETSEIFQLSEELVASKKIEISKFLDEHEYTVAESEKAADIIMRDFLIPEIDNLRI